MSAAAVDDVVLAVDLGGTHMRVALVTAAGELVAHRVEVTPHGSSTADPLLELMAAVLEGSGATDAVVGVAGRIDYYGGRLERAPNLPVGWAQTLTTEALSSAIGIPVALANDADLATVGETCFGAGRGYDDVVFLTVSTGVGAGVMLVGQLVHGRRSLAEIGQTLVDVHSARHDRLPATLEAQGSGTALMHLADAMGFHGGAADLERAVRAGDSAATAVWEQVVDVAKIAVANLAHLYSPQVLIVGGGLGLVGELLLGPLREALTTMGPKDLPTPIALVGATLGDNAGLVGAARWRACFAPALAGSAALLLREAGSSGVRSPEHDGGPHSGPEAIQ